jgi:hypothetical protein
MLFTFVVRDFARPIKPGFLCPAAGLVAVNLHDIFGVDRYARFVFQGEGEYSLGH